MPRWLVRFHSSNLNLQFEKWSCNIPTRVKESKDWRTLIDYTFVVPDNLLQQFGILDAKMALAPGPRGEQTKYLKAKVKIIPEGLFGLKQDIKLGKPYSTSTS